MVAGSGGDEATTCGNHLGLGARGRHDQTKWPVVQRGWLPTGRAAAAPGHVRARSPACHATPRVIQRARGRGGDAPPVVDEGELDGKAVEAAARMHGATRAPAAPRAGWLVAALAVAGYVCSTLLSPPARSLAGRPSSSPCVTAHLLAVNRSTRSSF